MPRDRQMLGGALRAATGEVFPFTDNRIPDLLLEVL